ncbi:cysteine desulfurase family protein [Facklamia miroungae]|uniref:Cysteine desulfurase n=1 Tax=Facklamia miroungae TaxID=120956 RepID=A0A1G7V5U9_9LACT|nr:cysteine desulfurase family protein [Facklamia miroungae]NKZ30250.1 cysteine desulfurase [Facklamia miroungae]SDG55182.1 cysteine desulfurase [Facklamia miroungae]
MLYFDYAATTPVDLRVQARISHALAESFGNPSANYKLGKASKNKLTTARRRLKALLKLDEASDLYFTSGATEAINWALRSQAYRARDLGLGHHIVTTAIEHSAVDRVLLDLENKGFEVTRLQPNSNQQFSLEQFIEASKQTTIGWTVMAVNNEVGSILPIKELGQYAKQKGYWFHVDATQAIGYQMINPQDFPCTSFNGSGHKFYAPKGIGFLVYQAWNKEMILDPLLLGGDQEYTKRSGTENLPYILGMVEALELMDQGYHELQESFVELSTYFFQQLNQTGIEYQRNGDLVHHNNRIHSIWLKEKLASQVIIQLDMQDIYLSAGSACSAGSIKPSRVLTAYYPKNEARWRESVRISFGRYTTKNEIDQLIEAITKIYQ